MLDEITMRNNVQKEYHSTASETQMGLQFNFTSPRSLLHSRFNKFKHYNVCITKMSCSLLHQNVQNIIRSNNKLRVI